MATYTDHHSRLKTVYFISTKSKALSYLINFIQDIAILPFLVDYTCSIDAQIAGENKPAPNFASIARQRGLDNNSAGRTRRNRTAN